METNENDEVSAISEVDVSEDLPNDDDSAFVSENHEDPQEHVVSTSDNQRVGGCDVETIHANHHGLAPMPDQVYVATSQGLVTAEQLHQAGIKTTHIVIHDETLSVEDDPCLKTPTTPLPPPTPSTPLSREKGFKYQWDDSAFLPILPVRCKSSNGELHKARFGSGGRGRCIKMGDNWYTPSEFEAVCGRASSKDWKRSIRYGGRTLQCLIEDAILNPHATSCTCAACCDDEAVTGPIRLFTPYKRRKRDSTGDILMQKVTSKANTPLSSPMKDTVVVSLAPSSMIHPLRVNNPEAGEMIQIIAADASGNITVGEPTVVMTPLPQTPKIENSIVNMLPLDVSEQKMWWQLEEMSNNLLQQAQQLKALLDQAKQQCIATKEHALMQLRQQLEKEKNDAINAVRIEAQMNLSRAVIEERAQKDIAVQHALAQARAEMQSDKLDTIGVSAADKVTYSVTWVPQPGSVQNIENMMDGEGDDSDKDKLS